MENRINILDDLTINKIAAGEVVERPSSVVKELIENCVDAKSTKIVVEIQDGGKKLIRITDNGIGIPSSEVEKSFLRHATSKINKIDDLYHLYSLGFRGEALASISSVSKLEMITRTKDEPIGTRVVVEGGKIVTKEPIGSSVGTTIIIKDIFYNTPARQKFLKSTHAETINISDLINKLAIGNPHIQFKYINNNKQMLNTPGDSKLLSVIRSIYGKDVFENLIEVNLESECFKLSGYIGSNNVYRSNKNLQHIYINNRFVKSKIILDSISEAYKGIIPINKHAVCFISLDINPSTIDVNIHPTKLEIKFENDQRIYIELRDYLRKKLLHSNLIGKYQANESAKKSSVSSMISPIVTKQLDTNVEIKEDDKVSSIVNESVLSGEFSSLDDILNKKSEEKFTNNIETNDINELNKTIISTQNRLINEYKLESDNLLIKEKDSIEEYFNIENEDKIEKDNNLNILDTIDLSESFSVEDLEALDKEESLIISTQEEFNIQTKDTKFSLIDYQVIGTLFSTYIIMSKGTSMYLLDQHAAHERVLYEEYMNKFYKSEINMQLLLDPIVLELSNIDMIHVENNLELFMKFGFEIELFGNNHIMIRCVPTTFGIPESEKFILQIIDNIDEIKNNYELKGEKFASMACRAAIKANDKIHNLEIDSLFRQMEMCENPFTCPHGRPIIVEISKTEIEKMFKRIM